MKKTLLLIPLYLFHLSCKNESNNLLFSLEPTQDTINIGIGENELNYSDCIQYFSENDTNYLAIKNGKRNSIYVYNLDKQKLNKEIIIPSEGKDAFPYFRSFLVKKLDTIILVSIFPNVVGFFNNNGQLIKKIPIEKDVNGNWLRPSESDFGQRMSLVNNNLVLLQINYYNEQNGIFTAKLQNQSNIALSVNLSDNKVKSIPLKYPIDLVGKDLFAKRDIWEQGQNSSFIYICSFMKFIFVTQDFSEFRKVPISTKYDLQLPENMTKFKSDLQGNIKYSASKDKLLSILYDTFNECYYLLVQKCLDDTNKDAVSKFNYRYPNCFIIILDKNFKHMGDVSFPENKYAFKSMFITKNGLYISEDNPENPTYNEDAMRFRLFKLIKL